jgi:hypothetical protein
MVRSCDLRLAHVVHALLEDADNRERNAADLEVLADSRIRAAEAVVGEDLRDHRALDVG